MNIFLVTGHSRHFNNAMCDLMHSLTYEELDSPAIVTTKPVHFTHVQQQVVRFSGVIIWLYVEINAIRT